MHAFVREKEREREGERFMCIVYLVVTKAPLVV